MSKCARLISTYSPVQLAVLVYAQHPMLEIPMQQISDACMALRLRLVEVLSCMVMVVRN